MSPKNVKQSSLPDFAKLTNRLLKSAVNGRIKIQSFRHVLPKLAKQITRDKDSPWLSVWGSSSNFDEHEQKQIVDRKILNVVGRLAGTAVRERGACHAGLIHTYGYLLSNLQTRYGFKRERWINRQLEQGLGLETPLLSMEQGTGSFFQNVSYMAGQFVIANASRLRKLGHLGVPEALVKLDYSGFQRQRIIETVKINQQKLEIFTDLIRLNRPLDSVLIYSYRWQRQQFLVTLFPMSKQGRTDLLKQFVGPKVLVLPRFNFYFPNCRQRVCWGVAESIHNLRDDDGGK